MQLLIIISNSPFLRPAHAPLQRLPAFPMNLHRLFTCAVWGAVALQAFAAEPGITPLELTPLPGGDNVAIWSMGLVNEVPVLVRTARIAGKADDPCRPNLLIVQGEKFKLAGQYAEAAMVLISKALRRHCKGQVWYAPPGQAPRLRADLRGEWHDAAGLAALLAGQSPQPMRFENLEFHNPTGSKAISVQQLQMEEQIYQEHRHKRPQYEANLQRFKQWKKEWGLKQHVSLDQWSRNPFAYGDQAISSAVIFNRALGAQEVSIESPRNQKPAYALLQQTDASTWQAGAFLVLIKPGSPKNTPNGPIPTAQVLTKVACTEFDCADQLLIPGQGDLPEVWGKPQQTQK